MCAHDQWSISEVLETKQHEGGDLIIGGGTSTFPVFHVICTNCGYTHTVNAVISGVLAQNLPTEPEADAER